MTRSSIPAARDARRVLVILTLVLAVSAAAAQAATTPEQQCQKSRFGAAAKYNACVQKALGGWFAGDELAKLTATLGKCVTKYTAVWPKLQAKAAGTGSTCDTARFLTSNPTLVFDRLTLLTWEKKTDDGSIHDKDNEYRLSSGGLGFTAVDGTAMTTFLANLNATGSCFNSQCDWRVPTLAEVLTILFAPEPCGPIPCIDPSFGPTNEYDHTKTSTPAGTFGVPALAPADTWGVLFFNGAILNVSKASIGPVRAVRGGM